MKTEALASLLLTHLEDKRVIRGANGASLICGLPRVGTHAFLHVLFDPVNAKVMEEEALESGYYLPASVQESLHDMNGAVLFQGKLSLYGVRGEISRDPAKRKPHDIYEANTLMRPRGALPAQCFIGFYGEDGSHLYIEAGDARVFRRQRKTPGILEEWPDIDTMIATEISKISQNFDCHGNFLRA